MRGVKQMFIRFKVTDAKYGSSLDRIYACVFIEYILSVYDSIGEEEQSIMAGDTKNSSQIQISDFSSIQTFSSNLHRNNGIIRSGNHNTYHIIEAKFISEKDRAGHIEGGVRCHMERGGGGGGVTDEPSDAYYYSNSLNFNEQTNQSIATYG